MVQKLHFLEKSIHFPIGFFCIWKGLHLQPVQKDSLLIVMQTSLQYRLQMQTLPNATPPISKSQPLSPNS